MTLSVADLSQIDELLVVGDAGASVFIELRRRLPHLSWTRCDASDVTEAPYRVYDKFDIHLVDSTDHCVRLTPDPECATGVVLARRAET